MRNIITCEYYKHHYSTLCTPPVLLTCPEADFHHPIQWICNYLHSQHLGKYKTFQSTSVIICGALNAN